MQNNWQNIAQYRPVLQRVFFSYAFVVWLYKLYSGTLLFQLCKPVLHYPGFDQTYWLFVLSNIPNQLVTMPLALLVDLLILIAILFSLFRPNLSFWPKIFMVFYGLYFLTFNLYSGHHYHNIGLLVCAIPFSLSRPKAFVSGFWFARFYFVFVLVSASLWKIFRGTLWHKNHFASILKEQNVEYFLNNNTGLFYTLKMYLIEQPNIVQAAWVILCFMQFCFITAIFTQRFDKILIIIYLLFITGSFTLMNINSIENTVLLITLIPWFLIFKNKNKPTDLTYC